MFCTYCGAQLQAGQAFCAACGKAVTGAAPPALGALAAEGRVARHVRLLGIFWIVISAFRLFIAAAVLIVGHSLFGRRQWHPDWGGPPDFVFSILSLVGVCFLIAALAGFAAGAGLLARRSWGRILALILGAINLLDLPIGTALGVYTFWALLPGQAEQEYRQLAGAA